MKKYDSKELQKKSKEELIRIIFALNNSLKRNARLNNTKAFVLRNNKIRIEKVIKELNYIIKTPFTQGVNPSLKRKDDDSDLKDYEKNIYK